MVDRARPEMLMPVSDEGAALQFFVEAMKANTSTLERIGQTLEGVQREQSDTLKLVHDTRERVIKIESNRVNRELEKLTKDVAELKDDKLRPEGAVGLATGTLRNGPIVVTLLIGIILMITVLIANGKLG